MKVSLKKIFKCFLDDYIKVHFDIKQNHHGLTTNYSNNEKYTLSKHSKTITHWFTDEHGNNFEEFEIVRLHGNIEIQNKNKKTLMKFSCPTEPLTFH